MSRVIIPLAQEYVYEYVCLFAGTSHDKKIVKKNKFFGCSAGDWFLVTVPWSLPAKVHQVLSVCFVELLQPQTHDLIY
jgi:hypothetical protein